MESALTGSAAIARQTASGGVVKGGGLGAPFFYAISALT